MIVAGRGRLKVYCTAIGFEDAYVAAKSQKAALAAWGTSKDLFARGAARMVTDERLAAAPLARPGEVIRVRRGSLAEHLAASTPAAKPAGKAQPAKPAPIKRKPRPSRLALGRAEAAIEDASRQGERRLREIDIRIDQLRARKDLLISRQEAQLKRLHQRRDELADRYRHALDEWSG
ncbi:hypothetical protein ACOYW6_13180 [Parablastomonas sp. CN1-191]|uniref:hypothetical protein n=1 Tax=Parablastomonas sp. CN1-191 TaxID=3400908 RepID=UPI003BF7D311